MNSSLAYADGGHRSAISVDLHQLRVLVVDANAVHCAHLVATLRQQGFSEVIDAAGYDAALHQLRTYVRHEVSEIDLVILDMTTAPAAARQLNTLMHAQPEWSDIPIIAIISSAEGAQDAVNTLFEMGATDVLFAPIRPAELISRVVSALLLKRERDLRKRREQELETELAERRVMEARLEYLVGHDDLTGLCNRRRLEQELELAVLNSRYHRSCGALLYLDLDQFKVVNDTEGHTAGDRLLINVANKLRRQIGSSGLLARISSDEYAILLENVSTDDAARAAEALRHLMDKFYFKTDDRTYHIGASVGIAMIVPDEELTASEILARADQACHIAKSMGRNTVHIYSHEDLQLQPLRNAPYWVPLIRDALANDKFCLYFQPVLDVVNGTITRYEALIRMIGENNTLIGPQQFIPVAEHTGLIHEIDLWVVGRAVDVLRGLAPHINLNVNLSSYAFQDRALLRLLSDKLQSTGVGGNRITFEITETAAVTNFMQSREMIMQLRGLGCRFALDDFGAGFSSFNYLKQFPVDYLKIDGAFISNLIHDSVDQTLVKSMIDIARTLNKKTVAEFVEDGATLAMLRDFGVDYSQGYYVGRPRPLALALA